MRRFLRFLTIFLLIFVCAVKAWGWGIRTHSVMGWYAAKDTGGTPPELQLAQYPHSNIQPDMFLYSPVTYSHDRAFSEIMFTHSDSPDEKAYTYGWISHLAVDYIGHTYYLGSGLEETLREISVDTLLTRSEDPEEAEFARDSVPEWDPKLITVASKDYVEQHGGYQMTPFFVNWRGFLTALVMAGELVIIDNDSVYAFARLYAPRSDWQGWFDISVEEAKKWCNELGQNGGFEELYHEEGEYTSAANTFYLRTGVSLLRSGAISIEDAEGKQRISIVDKRLCQNILKKKIDEGVMDKNRKMRRFAGLIKLITKENTKTDEVERYLNTE
jgi:hypothetical protein